MSAKRVKTRHAGVYQRGSRYTYTYRDREGRQHWGAARTLEEAVKVRRSLMVKADHGEYIAPSKITLGAYLSEWIETYGTDGTLRAPTRADYRGNIEKRLIPQLGHLQLRNVGKSDVKGLITWLCDDDAQGRHLSDHTIRGIVGTLSSCLSYAAEDEMIAANPVLGVKLPKRDKDHAIKSGTDTPGSLGEEKARILTDEQTATLIEATPDDHRLLVTLLAVTGLRISEALALRWGDFDRVGQPRLSVTRMVTGNPDRKPTDDWWIFQPPKSRAGTRSVPLPEEIAEQLQQRRVELIADGTPAGERDLAFATRRGTPLDQKNLRRRAFAPAAKAAGVEWAGFHALRHTCASRLFAAGMNPKQIAKWLGHSDAAFTMRTYVHLMPDDAPDALPVPTLQSGNGVVTAGRLEALSAA